MENEKIEQIKNKLKGRKIEEVHIHRNSKYGEFIIQTNEVQLRLSALILLRTTQDEKISKYLEGLTLGNLINCFRICAKNPIELAFADCLDLYNRSRNALAHKMYSKKELTETDCETSIKLGEKFLIKLKEMK